ncbi:MAG: polyprenyl synthetase family protein, partial [Chloroflexota bacterium]
MALSDSRANVDKHAFYEPIRGELAQVEDNLRKVAQEGFPHLSRLLEKSILAQGKRVRPAITLLASHFHERDSLNPVLMATATELLHIASLIHDDTVDDAPIRRGQPTISNLFSKREAVLVGDYVFARSATFVSDTGNVRAVRRFSEAIMALSSGEL